MFNLVQSQLVRTSTSVSAIVTIFVADKRLSRFFRAEELQDYANIDASGNTCNLIIFYYCNNLRAFGLSERKAADWNDFNKKCYIGMESFRTIDLERYNIECCSGSPGSCDWNGWKWEK